MCFILSSLFSMSLSFSLNLFVLIFAFPPQTNRPKFPVPPPLPPPPFTYVIWGGLLHSFAEPHIPHLKNGFKGLRIIVKPGDKGPRVPSMEPDKLSKCSLHSSCSRDHICNNKVPPYSWKGQSPLTSSLAIITVPLNASVPRGTDRDSSLSTVTSLLCSALQTPLNKLFQFSARLLPMEAAM